MILVHVLSQVINPYAEFWKAQTIIELWNTLGLNEQPLDS
jgi:hypothetical protein